MPWHVEARGVEVVVGINPLRHIRTCSGWKASSGSTLPYCSGLIESYSAFAFAFGRGLKWASVDCVL